jgi:uncharacterized protein
MSEISQHKSKRMEQLLLLFHAILEKDKPVEAIRENQETIDNTQASDIIALVDILMQTGIPIDKLKTGINKFINVLGKTIKSYPDAKCKKNSLLDVFMVNNAILSEKLKAVKPLFRQLNENPDNSQLKNEIAYHLAAIALFENYYAIKENILFPLIEKFWSDYRCLHMMWSFHDDIRSNLKKSLEMIQSKTFDLMQFNKLIGDLYFNMYAIILREEKLLFPWVAETIPEENLSSILPECIEMGFPYFQPKIDAAMNASNNIVPEGTVNLETGALSADQIILLFNHLPVDITFVDENNKVRYFSTPPKRIFPRSKAIIGRDVHNCHPPESVHVVEQIVESFRNGEKNVASFWINMKAEKILIQYFALRDKDGNYKGVIEVSQEISSIQSLQGEQRLLDWAQ